MPNIATLCYVPRSDRLWPLRFLKNMDHYKTEYPVIYFSDSTQGRWADFITIPNPEPLKSSKNKTAIQNGLMLHAIKIASEMGIDRFIYVESDSRVGCDYWDRMMMDDWKTGSVVAGTPNLFNSLAMPEQHQAAVKQYISDYTEATGLPMAHFLANDKTKRLGSCVFMMGSGAIYDTRAMLEMFPNFDNCLHSYACRTAAFDLHIGLRMFQIYGAKALELMPFLTKSFSGFGGKVLNLEQRVDRLRSGQACLIHQFKEKDDLLNEPNRNVFQRTGRFN